MVRFLLDNFGNTKVPQRLGRALNGCACCFFPRVGACSDEFDDLVNTLCHHFLPGWKSLDASSVGAHSATVQTKYRDFQGSCSFCPLILVAQSFEPPSTRRRWTGVEHQAGAVADEIRRRRRKAHNNSPRSTARSRGIRGMISKCSTDLTKSKARSDPGPFCCGPSNGTEPV